MLGRRFIFASLAAICGVALSGIADYAMAVTYTPSANVQCGVTGHFYQVVQVDFVDGDRWTWESANTYAMSAHYQGLPGHLLTIETSAERGCLGIHNNFGGFLGAGGAPNWVWTVGPAAGSLVQFYATYRGSNYGPTPQVCNPKNRLYYWAGEYWDVPGSMFTKQCSPSQSAIGIVIEYEPDTVPPQSHQDFPNGGEELTVGSVASLAWTASDAFGSVESVDLELSRSGPGGPFEPIAMGLAPRRGVTGSELQSAGAYQWLVTGPPTQDAYIRITSHDTGGNAVSDLSDEPFAIAVVVPGLGTTWGGVKAVYR